MRVRIVQKGGKIEGQDEAESFAKADSGWCCRFNLSLLLLLTSGWEES